MEDMWQRNASLADTNLRMLEDEILCDVTFLAGETRQAVKAHKYMLASRSPVLYAMFCGAMAETSDQIPVPDIEADILKELLRYMYTGLPRFTSDTVMSLMYAGNKYDVPALATACCDYLKSNIQPENVCTILEQIFTFGNKEIVEHCQVIIEDNANAVLDSEAFLALPSSCLRRVLSMDRLRDTEEHVYTSCVKWAKQECTRRGKEANDAGCREVLGDMVYLIRFPCMSFDTFTKVVSNSGILSTEDKVNVFQQFSSVNKNICLFNSTYRANEIVVKRFGKIASNLWHHGGTDAISFSCSENTVLTGVGIYTPVVGVNNKCSLQVFEQELLHVNQEIILQESMKYKVHDVWFEKPLSIKRNVWYRIVQMSHGDLYCYGNCGDSSVSEGELTVTFFDIPSGSVYSGIVSGQIPCLHFLI